MAEYNRNELLVQGTTSVVVSNDKTELETRRKNITITNSSIGNQKLTISIDKPSVDRAGIVLYPGGTWSDNAESGYEPTQKAIHVISDIADASISLSERGIQ